MTIPVSDGPFKGEVLHRNKFDEMLDEYYECHGWNKKTGLQEIKTLREKGFDEIADFLENN
jgi:aldehyde:ferredoxin oxidoreductase